MAERVASGEVFIGLHDEATAGLRRIEQQFDRTMDRIERERATATIDADKSAFDRTLDKARAELAEWEKKRATASVAERRRIDDEIAAQKRYIGAIERRIATAGKASKAQRRATADLKYAVGAIDALRQRTERLDTLEKKMAARRIQEYKRQTRVRDSLNRQYVREMNNAERQARQMDRERDGVAKLESRYVRLHDTLDKLNAAKRRIRGDKQALFRLEVEERGTIAEIEAIRSKIQAVAGRDPIEIPVKLGERWGRELRYEFMRHGGHLPSVAAAVGDRTGRALGTRINTTYRDTLDRGLSGTAIAVGKRLGGGLVRGAVTGLSAFGRALDNLSEASVRLGPFTTSVRGAFIGLSLLAPVLIDVVGAASALVGSVGSATVGVGALGVAVLGGAIPAFAGMGFVIADVVKEFSALKTLQEAYDKALMEGNTDLAKDKMQAMKEVMGNVSNETVKQVGLMSKLGDQWDKATQPARADVFTSIGEGLKTASALMPMFAKNTNEVMDTASKGVNEWMKALRSAEGEAALDTMMDNFNKALGPALAGMGDFMGYLGRVGAIASGSLPGLAKTFRSWADGLNDVSDSDLKDKVEGVIDSAKTLGRFLLSGGRLFKSFFGAGVDEGNKMIDDMTAKMDEWRKTFESPAGQNDLQNFFKESADGARAFFSALAPVVKSFVNWAQSIAPFARAFFDGAAAIGNFVSSILELTALRAPLAALVTTLGALWAVGKIKTATGAVAGFVGALTGLGRSQTTVARSAQQVARTPGAGFLPFIRAGDGIEKTGAKAATAAKNVGALARVGSGLSKGLSGLGALAIGVSNPIAGLAVAAGAATLGIVALTSGADDWEESLQAAQDGMEESNRLTRSLSDSNISLAQGYVGLKQANLGVKQAEQQLTALRQAGKQGTQEYRAAQLQYNSALLEQQRISDTVTKATRQQAKVTSAALASRKQDYDDATRGIEQLGEAQSEFQDSEGGIETISDRYREAADQAERTGESLEDVVNSSHEFAGDEGDILDYADALDLLETTAMAYNRTARRAALETLNQQRATKMLGPLARSAGADIQYLNSALGKQKTTKIGLKFEGAEDAARVANAAARSLKAGVPKSVTTRILADSKNADAAVRKLNKARITPKRLRIIEDGGQKAINTMEKIIGKKLTPKQQRILLQGDGPTLAKLAKVAGIKLPTKKQVLTAVITEAITGHKKVNSEKLEDKKASLSADPGPAIAGAARAQAAINSVQGKTVTITTVHKSVGKQRASGQRAGSTPVDAFVGEGSRWQGAKEWIVNRATGSVTAVDEPTMMSLDRDTAVIPTEPRFRDRGREIFRNIARDLGIASFAGGFDGGSFIAREPVFNPPKKKSKNKFKSAAPWARYIGYLQNQQEHWEREVSIRESQVEQPENMIIRDTSKDQIIVDPLTGDQTEIEGYSVNPDIENVYKPQLMHVLEAFRTLLDVIRELVRAVPLAVAANEREHDARHNKVYNKNDGLMEQLRRVRATNPTGDRAKQEKAEKIEDLKQKIEHEKTKMRELKEDQRTLNDERIEAGFSFRETQIARNEIRKEYDTAAGDAQTELTEQMESGSGGGGGGGGSTGGGVTYGAQAALADTEKAAILREFGSNFSPTGAFTTAIASAVGGSLSALASPTGTSAPSLTSTSPTGDSGTAADLTAARTASRSSSTASQEVASSGTATSGGTSAGSTTTYQNKNVTINNTYATAPEDPHTYSKGVEFEIGAAL